MSNPADVAKASGFLKFGSRIYGFRIPICRPTIDYQASFKSSTGNPDAASFVAILAQSRTDMINTLYTVPNAYDLKLKAVDAYLLQCYRLADCFGTQTLQLDRDLAFEWKGAVTDQVDFSKSCDIIFEIMFMLHTKAILHSAAAKALVDTDPVAFLSDAAKHLLEASSIMLHLSANIESGQWNRKFNKRHPNPVELSQPMCAALAMLFKGQAQAMSFMKAVTAGGTAPATIKSRLAVGVVNSMAACFDQLCGLPDAATAYLDLLTFAHVTRQFYTALAYQHSAQAYAEKTEVGNAIAFCLSAKLRLGEQKSSSKPAWMAPGVPKFVGPYAELGFAAAHLLDTLNQIQAQAEQDNKFVYFQPVPGPNSTNSSAGLPLPDLPAEASVMNPTAFKEPDRSGLGVVLLEYKAKPSIFSSMFSSLVGGGGATAAPTGEPAAPTASAGAEGAAPSSAASAPSAPPAPTDAEYARRLQQQYDAEARAPAQQQQQQQQQQQGAPPPAPGAPAAPKYNSMV